MKRICIFLLIIIGLNNNVQAERGNMLIIPTSEQTDVRLTVYNNNLAVIRDTRNKPEGYSGKAAEIAFEAISSKILPETCTLEGVQAAEQNFNYDLLDTYSLLERNIGKNVTMVRENNLSGEEIREQVTVLSVEGRQVVLKMPDNLIRIGLGETYLFDNLAGDLWLKPTLTLNILGEAQPSLTLTCQSNGLAWVADYTAVLNKAEDRMSLSGWMTLKNETNVDYIDAKLTLFAGEPHILQRQQQRGSNVHMYSPMDINPNRQSIQLPEQEMLSDYFLYEFPQRVDIQDKQEKQLALLSVPSASISKDYFYPGELGRELRNQRSAKPRALVRYTFINSKEEGLGRPIPKGIVRFYQSDEEGERHFIGAGEIANTAQGETVRIFTGEAFGITLEKTVSGKKRNPKNNRNAWEVTYTIKNSTRTAINLVLEEVGSDKYIVTNIEVHGGEKISHGRYHWRIDIPAGITKQHMYQVEELRRDEYYRTRH